MIALLLILVWAVSAFVCSGLIFRHLDSRHVSSRETLGVSLAIGSLYGFLGPVGIGLSFLISGFAERGFGFTPVRKP